MSPKLPRITAESGQKNQNSTNAATRQIPRSRPQGPTSTAAGRSVPGSGGDRGRPLDLRPELRVRRPARVTQARGRFPGRGSRLVRQAPRVVDRGDEPRRVAGRPEGDDRAGAGEQGLEAAELALVV